MSASVSATAASRDRYRLYRLYGIQSEWLPQSRFVRIERIENVPTLIDAYVAVTLEGSSKTPAAESP
jgi:hypothetical protein